MIMTSINKVKFANHLNDKGYYFSDGIISLAYGHPLLKYKKSLPKIHTVIERERDRFLRLENEAAVHNERLRILRSIFAQPFVYYKLNSTARHANKINYISTRDYILNSMWL